MGKKHERQAKKAAAAAKAAPETTAKVDVAAVAEAAANPAVAEAVKKAARVKKPAAPAKEGALPKLPRLASAGRAARVRPTKPCACGCEGSTKSEWVPGHDARAKGWAIRIERGLIKMSDVPVNEQPGAKLMLKRRAEAAAAPANSNLKLVTPPAAAVNE